MAVTYLGLGSNIGNKRYNLIRAAALLAERAGDILALSEFYETTPWGFVSTNLFLNAAVRIETGLSPEKLLLVTQAIEKELGRKGKSKGQVYQDRVIDLDLLLYDDVVLQTPALVIPHPQLCQRRFILEPLAEIAPSVVIPGSGKSVTELLAALGSEDTSR